MFEKLDLIQKRYDELSQLLAQAEIATDHRQLQELSKEKATLEDIVDTYRQYKARGKELSELEALLNSHAEAEMTALVKDEIGKLKRQQDELLRRLKLSLTPKKDPNDERDVIVEIRAGAGGDEASLFAADLFRMYSRYAQAKGWQAGIIDSNQSERGGFKELIFEIKGRGAFSRFKQDEFTPRQLQWRSCPKRKKLNSISILMTLKWNFSIVGALVGKM